MVDAYRKMLIFFLFILYSLFVVELFKKSIVAGNYYRRLSSDNSVQSVPISAPRGIFYDKNGLPLVKNEKKSNKNTRTYIYGNEYAHILGYVGLPDEKSLKDISCGTKASSTQFVGVYGLEKTFECKLRGKPGWQYVETDARGVQQAELAKDPPTAGSDIHLTFDTDLQKVARKAFGSLIGAAIASNPNTGEVYMLYSSPSFDPNTLLSNANEYASLSSDIKKPLLNRALLGTYPPGSVIKPLIALGALEDGIIDTSTEFEDTGVLRIGDTSFGNWYFLQYGKKEGMVNVRKALARSNDIFFYQIGKKSGIERMHSWFTQFGLADTDMSNFFPQQVGILPNDTWKQKQYAQPWFLGDTINISIGQGYILVNPVQMHEALSIIASNGLRCAFQVELGQRRDCTRMSFSTKNIQEVREGMRQACETGGTAWPFFDFSAKGKRISVGCKTGTAESQGNGSDPHAWFSAFAPYNNPSIVITVLVENGGEGSSIAAPIAKEILTKYFSP
ncbi:MAG: penicillin-binding transpeptidase domain-containing protein [Candidatus Roizmanbacteria bacterium]|nr:penicillin-binding transpeptidase domain-containing protein [Candidatus Roizmanbacteria bacterium]